MRTGPNAAIAIVIASCGPSSDEQTTDGSSESSAAGSTTQIAASTGESTTLEDPESTGQQGTSTSIDESSSGTTTSCSCVTFSLAVDEPTPEGFSFVDLVAALPEVEAPWVWTAIDGMPTTTVHMRFEVARGEASWEENECGRDDNCRDLFGPITLVISTDDGMLDDERSGFIRGILGERAQLDVPADALASFMGTLPDAMFVDADGDPIVVDNVGINGLWTWDGDTANGTFSVYEHLVNQGIVLGETVE